MQLFKMKHLARFAAKERIPDASLIDAILRAESGLVDADLGGGLIKQRVARRGQGRSGGYRFIIAYRAFNRAVFLFGFAKNDQANLTHDQLREFRQLASELLAAEQRMIVRAVQDGVLQEIEFDEEKSKEPNR